MKNKIIWELRRHGGFGETLSRGTFDGDFNLETVDRLTFKIGDSINESKCIRVK
jgi:hypothetical protein